MFVLLKDELSLQSKVKIKADCKVTFTKKRLWLLSGHATIQTSCNDACCSGRFFYLHRGAFEHWQSGHRVLGHLNASDRPANSRKTSTSSKVLPDLCLKAIVSQGSTDNYFEVMLGLYSDLTQGTYRKVFTFPNHAN